MSARTDWSTDLTALTKIIAGDASSPTLKNLATAAGVLGGTGIANQTNRAMYSAWTLRFRGATAFILGEAIYVYFIAADDATNYEDGGASVQPAWEPDLIFQPRLVATQQKVTIKNVLIYPGLFKPLVWNGSARSLTNTDNENELYYKTYGSLATAL